MLVNTVVFLVGVVLLCLGANWLVRGATIVAEIAGIPKPVVGLTMVALGTSAPELFVNVLAAWSGNTEFALSNVSGSNLANLCIGLGLCAAVGGITIHRHDFSLDMMMVVATPLLVWGIFYSNRSRLLPVWAILPLTALLLFYCWSLRGRPGADEIPDVPRNALRAGLMLFALGIAALYFGGKFVLDSAVAAAESLNIGKDVIALTVVALGTSIPDITATVVAARRQEFGIAVGNILGSNISNVVLVLNGTIVTSMASLPTTAEVRLDYLAVCIVSAVCCALVFLWERLSPRVGVGLLIAYAGYIGYRLATLPGGVGGG